MLRVRRARPAVPAGERPFPEAELRPNLPVVARRCSPGGGASHPPGAGASHPCGAPWPHWPGGGAFQPCGGRPSASCGPGPQRWVTPGPARGPRLGPCGEARDQVHDDADEREKEKKNGPHARRHSPWRDAAGPLVAFRKEIAHGSQGDAQHQTVHEGRAGVNDGQADELLNVHTSSVTAYCTAAANLSSPTG